MYILNTSSRPARTPVYVMDVQEGMNHFNGEQALAFSRERHNLDDGDNQRGRNQQAVITAMLKKVISPTMLLRAGSLMDQVSKDVEMNVTQDQLNALIRKQLGSNAKWSIQSVDLTGDGRAGLLLFCVGASCCTSCIRMRRFWRISLL